MRTVTPDQRPDQPPDADRARRIAITLTESVHGAHRWQEEPATPGNVSRGSESAPMGYPTWAIRLWLDNDEWSQRAAESIVSDAINAALARLLADEQAPISPLLVAGDEMKKLAEAGAPITGGMYGDLLGWAIGAADWERIAYSFVPGRGELYALIMVEVLEIIGEMDCITASARTEDGDEEGEETPPEPPSAA